MEKNMENAMELGIHGIAEQGQHVAKSTGARSEGGRCTKTIFT